MPEHVPTFEPGKRRTRTASAAVTGGRVCAISGVGTTAHAGAASAAWEGVALFDAASGASVTVMSGGVHPLVAAGAITAGDQLVTGANGTVATGVPASPAAFVGLALTSAADGGTVEVQLAR